MPCRSNDATSTPSTTTDALDARWNAFKAHVTQISDANPFVRFGRDSWRDFWSREAYVRVASRVPAPNRETDLFEGLSGREPGPTGWS